MIIRDSKGYGGLEQLFNKNKGDIDNMKIKQANNLKNIDKYIMDIQAANTMDKNKENVREGFKLIVDNANYMEEHFNSLIEDLNQLKSDENITSKVYHEDIEKIEGFKEDNKVKHTDLLDKMIGRLRTAIKLQSKVEGGKLDQDTIDLLNSPISLTQDELQDFINNEFRDNPTMIRVIEDYAKDKRISVVTITLDDRLASIDRLLDEGTKAIRNVHSYIRFKVLEDNLEDIDSIIETI